MMMVGDKEEIRMMTQTASIGFFGWILAMLIVQAGFGATYHVATSGLDEAAGTQAAPFQTIQRAASIMRPGDTCIVAAGVYRETIRPANPGAPEAPITIRAEEGADVIVNGTEPVSHWTEVEAGLWRAAIDGPVDQLFVEGRMMPLACWPNTCFEPLERAWATAGPSSEAGRIFDGQIPAISVDGAMIHALPGEHWVSWTRPVTGFDGETHVLSFTCDWSQEHAYKVQKGTRYFLYGTRALLDAAGEWAVDPDGNGVLLRTPDGQDPNTTRVEIKRRRLAFDLAGLDHVRIEGFRIFAATMDMSGAESCTVHDCHIRYASEFLACDGWSVPKDSGIIIGGRNNVLERCSLVYSAGNGVTLLGENNRVENCVVQRANYRGTDCGAVWMEGTGNILRRCTLFDTGRSVLLHRVLKNGRIEYNNMYNAGRLTTDLGITYCFQTDGAGTVIAHNWVHHNLAARCGVGIYIDNGSSNFLIHHNVSWANGDSGIRLNTPSHNNLVVNNTVLDNGNSLNLWGPDNNRDQAGCRIVNNLFNNEVVIGDGAEATSNYTGSDVSVISVDGEDFRLLDGSPLIDAGTRIDGITDGYAGKSPDIGAYEAETAIWKAGHDWGEPPQF